MRSTRAAAEKGARRPRPALCRRQGAGRSARRARRGFCRRCSRKRGKDGDFVLIGRVVAPLVLEMKPSTDLGWFAGDANGACLLLAGHPAEARYWFAVADPDSAQGLYPPGPGSRSATTIAWDGKQLAASVCRPCLKADSENGARQAAIVLALLSAFDDPVGPCRLGAALRPPCRSPRSTCPGAPIWFDLPRAGRRPPHRRGRCCSPW